MHPGILFERLDYTHDNIGIKVLLWELITWLIVLAVH